ncbi:MAG TPA: hypothetical protein VK479_10490 [Micropepsaceae bacterium]|nr:hypothetical protein [Micropepsaceae bacterium]
MGLEGNTAGRDLKVNIEANSYAYMIERGPAVQKAFFNGPGGSWDPEILGRETVEDLRVKLIINRTQLEKPQPIKVTGSLFPCALLSSGWWEKNSKSAVENVEWRDEVQQWLFQGFDLWGPSWDFSWDFENWESSKQRPYFIAQLGDGDEANSLPVLIPKEKAQRLQEYIDAKGRWGGIQAEIRGVLGHRRHFDKCLDPAAIDLFGGLLDYCLWIDESDPSHGIAPLPQRTEIYSGYLWRCVAPESLLRGRPPSLQDVYFVWEHTNFASKDAVAYNVDALERKQEYLERKLGKLVLIQKSSFLVPGTPAWSQQQIYQLVVDKSESIL